MSVPSASSEKMDVDITEAGDRRTTPEPKKTNVQERMETSIPQSVIDRARWLNNPLPEKLSRGKQSKAVMEVEVQANMRKLSLDPTKPVYKYRIDIINDNGKKKQDITKGAKHDQATQARRRVTTSLFFDILTKAENNKEALVADKYSVVYDTGNLIYSAEKMNIGDDSEFILNMTESDVSSSNSREYLGKNISLEVIIKLVAVLQQKPSTGSDSATFANNRELAQFLEIVTSGMVNKNGDYFSFGNKSYEKSSRNDANIGEGKVVKSGNEKNCRIVDQQGVAVSMLQVDPKKSPFFSGQSLLQLIAELVGCRDPRDIERALEDRRIRKKLDTQLSDLWVVTTHQKKNREFPIQKLSNESADRCEFTKGDDKITVEHYYETTYKMRLKYPHLPLAVERRQNSTSYHPLELLEVVRGQRVTTKKSTPQMAEKMIKECQLKPSVMVGHISKQIKDMDLEKQNKYLKAFNMSVSDKTETTVARLLHPPAIKYQGITVEPQRDGVMNWKLGGRERFIKGASLTQRCYVLLFDRCTDESSARRFIEALARCGQEHGMNFDPRQATYLDMSSELYEKMSDIFKKASKEKGSMIFSITKMKLDPVHHVLKELEAKFSVITQHICMQTFLKAIGNQGAFMVLGNLILKTNLKLGGIKHLMDVSKVFSAANPDDRTAATRLLPKSRMVIGLDVSHAGPQSYSDRLLHVPQSEPTIVGMCFTTGMATEMRGQYWAQEPRLASVSNLDYYMNKALKQRVKETKRLPDDIIVFRGGVSEGEFGKVYEEMEELRKAFVKFGDNYTPALTCIVVATNSNYRILPERINERDRPMDQNVRPGTCVSEDIVSPMYNEFILVPQKALQGTARPIRCTITYRQEGTTGQLLSLDDCQLLTNYLCYGHQVVCGPTGQPSVLYSATNLTKRGRNNWKTSNFRESDADDRSTVSGSSGGRQLGRWTMKEGDNEHDFFDKMSKDIQSSIPTHYWA